jgi:RNA polymerase sigma-70 factor (ECF subfamily)
MSDSLSLSFLVLLETLDPVERAVFLLREVFAYPYDEIAAIVEVSEVNCRQILTRARRRIDEGRPRLEADRARRQELATTFRDAFDNGELDHLVDLLAADVVFYGDGRGTGRGLTRPVYGRDRVVRLLGSFRSGYRAADARLEPTVLNGQPGTLNFDRDGRLIDVFVLDIADGVIQAIRAIVNPDELGHLGFPLSDLGPSPS